MSVFQWSTTPATNATIDPQINLATSRAPSSVTPADRSTLAALAGYRMDISGAMADTGVANAYLLTSASNYNQITDSQTALQTLGNNQIAFTPANTNTGTSTLSVDGLGPFPLRSSPNVEIAPGVLIAGSPVSCIFNSADSAFYLLNIYGAPTSVPLGTVLSYAGHTAPSSQWALCQGQAISRTAFASLFALISTTYGVGDGSTTFNIPDLRGRVVAALDPTGTILNSATMTPDGNTLGAKGGGQNATLSIAQLPNIGSNVSVSVSGSVSVNTPIGTGGINANAPNSTAYNGSGNSPANNTGTGSFSGTGTGTATSSGTGGSAPAHANLQPTMALNKLIRVL